MVGLGHRVEPEAKKSRSRTPPTRDSRGNGVAERLRLRSHRSTTNALRPDERHGRRAARVEGREPRRPGLAHSDDTLHVTEVDDRAWTTSGSPVHGQPRRARQPASLPEPEFRSLDKFGPVARRRSTPGSSFGLHTSSDGSRVPDDGRVGRGLRQRSLRAQWGNLFGPPAGTTSFASSSTRPAGR